MLIFSSGCAENQKIRVTQQRMAKPSEKVTEEEGPFSDADSAENEVKSETLYVITEIDKENKTVSLMDTNSGRQRTYKYDNYTKFYDKYGETS